MNSDALLGDAILLHKNTFQLVYEMTLDHYLATCIFARQIRNCCAASKFELKLMSKSVNLLHDLIFFKGSWDEGLQTDDFCHIFVHYFIGAQLDAFESALSELKNIYLNLLSPVSLSESW